MHPSVGFEDSEPVVFCDGPTTSRGMEDGINEYK